MRFLERNDTQQQRQPGGADGDTEESLEQARQSADRMLSVGDEAIRRVLAGGNSEAFLRSVTQQGGQ